MTRGVGRWSLDKEKRKRPHSSDRHKADQQCGAPCHTGGLTYDPRSWPLESGQRKAETAAQLRQA
ncbi:hypothetical protein BBH88_06975 [Planococcus antarcticus DSM 14505]|uniref:Uncharacterized protein n=1 Tax=Planococcus antarcticus DSM 14505 TaxID=1185653 RepID=A0ABN4RDD1_9BACL|nr:hypothetical protein BBH88_06975 [Planococcus antarcticus DSM 14505]